MSSGMQIPGLRRPARYHVVCLVIFLLMSVFATPQDAQARWEVREKDGQQFLTLKSFCEFYDFPYEPPGGARVFKTGNRRFKLEFNRDSRIVFINNIRHWMSFGCFVVENKETGKPEWLVSKIDLIKLFEPIFRPHLIKTRRPVKGIVLDPGHGGSDKGAVSRKGKREKDYALDLAFRIEKILRSHGIRVVMTRRSDVFVDLRERTKRADQYKDFLFVSLHFNAANRTAKGLEVYACTPPGAGSTMAGGRVKRADYQAQNGNETDRRNILLAHEIQRELIKLYPKDRELDRGVKRARFVVLRTSTLPAVLVEGGFLDNSWEARLIDRSSHRQKLAERIASGVRSYVALMESPTRRLTTPTLRPPTIISKAPPIETKGSKKTKQPKPKKPAASSKQPPPTVIYPAGS